MNSALSPVACDWFAALIAGLDEDTPERIVTRTILDHLATCPTCCRAEALLSRQLAAYRRTATPALPAGSA